MSYDFYPNKETKIFISISSNPGSSGSLFHNTCFKILGLNCIYIPMKVSNLKGVFESIKKFNFKGCSVSMPFKEHVIPYLDKFDVDVKNTQNSNTIINKDNTLLGKNTDVYGAKNCLSKIQKKKYKSAFIYGAGGVSKSICLALLKNKFKKIYITSRNLNRFNNWPMIDKINIISWKDRDKISADLLVNATPIGMHGINKNKSIISQDLVCNFKCVFDVVVSSSSTTLIDQFKKERKNIITGLEMSFHQACKQFEYYNKIKPPIKEIKKILKYKFI